MSEPDPKTTLRELHEYFARSYEPQNKLAARMGVTHSTPPPGVEGSRASLIS